MTPQLAEADGGALTVEHRTLYEHVSQGVKNHPQNTAIVCMHQPSDHLGHLIQPHTAHVARQYLVWTYRDLNTAAQRVALGLQARGVRRGSTIATLIQNGVEWAILRNAAVLLDLTFVPLDHGMVTSARQEELTNLMKVLEPAAVVAMDLEAANAVSRSSSKCCSAGRARMGVHGRSAQISARSNEKGLEGADRRAGRQRALCSRSRKQCSGAAQLARRQCHRRAVDPLRTPRYRHGDRKRGRVAASCSSADVGSGARHSHLLHERDVCW